MKETDATEGYPAARLTDMGIEWLAARYPGSLIIREFSIGTWGGALIDLAAVTETEIIGVEIKGDGDSPSRLKLQVPLYSKAAQRMWLLPAPSLAKRCEAAAWLGWGLLTIGDDGAIRTDSRNAWRSAPRLLPTAPGQLLQALWADELRYIAGAGIGGSCEGVRAYLAEEMPLKTLIPRVCDRLRARDWGRRGLGHKITWATPQPANDLFPKDTAA